MEVHIANDPMSMCKKIYIRQRIVGGAVYFNFLDGKMNIIESATVSNGQAVEDRPTFVLQEDMFLALVDAIHRDYKPSEGKFTEGKLEATEKHLEDMRNLVFKKK